VHPFTVLVRLSQSVLGDEAATVGTPNISTNIVTINAIKIDFCVFRILFIIYSPLLYFAALGVAFKT
jgi:hypothetical protein